MMSTKRNEDAILLDLVGARSAEAREALEAWSEAQPGSLAASLERAGHLKPGARKILSTIARGFLHLDDPSSVLRDGALEALRAELEPLRPPTFDSIFAELEDAAPAPLPPPPAAHLESATGAPPTRAAAPVEPDASEPHLDEAMRPARSLPQVGDTLGRCLLTEVIGRGGSATVFRALHTGLRVPVAVKVIPQTADAPRWAEEGALLARLNHPNIVRVLDVVETEDLTYLVLEHIDGLSLRELLSQSGALAPLRAARIARCIASALDHALERGIYHRDLKPANVLLTKAGEPRLADLGISTIVEGDSDPASSSPERIAGTLAFIAPERLFEARPADHRADIYALGVTLFAMLTGELPFNPESPHDLWIRLLQGPFPAASSLCAAVDDKLSALIQRLLARKPEDRPATYREVIAALDDWIAVQSDRPAPSIYRSTTVSSATLRGATPSLSGSISGNALVEVIQFLHQADRTGRLHVEHDGAVTTVEFERGSVTDAIAPKTAPEVAFYRVLRAKSGAFAFVDGETSKQIRIRSSTPALLMNAARQLDESQEESR